MNIVDRVKRICLSPQSEWSVIDGESASTPTLLSGYVIPLAAISAIAAFIGNSIVGMRVAFVGANYRVPIGTGLGMAVIGVGLTAVAVVVCGMIIDALAPTFGAQKSNIQALKVASYAPTAAWAAGVFQIIPALGFVTILGGLYSLYLLYLGLPRLMKCPADKAVGYTAVVVLCMIVMAVVIGMISGALLGSVTGYV